MSYTMQTIALLPSYYYETGRAAPESFKARIKNLLLGRIFANWEDSILVAGIVFWVIQAAISFFTGHWILAIAELMTSGFLAKVRRDYRDFLNLSKQTDRYSRENDTFKLSNWTLKNNIHELEKIRNSLSEKLNFMQEQNNRFKFSNTRYEEQIKSMETILKDAAVKFENASARSENTHQRILNETLEQLNAHRAFTLKIQEEVLTRKDEALEQWGEIVSQVASLKTYECERLEEVQRKLDKTLQDIATYEGVKASLENQIARLRAQVNTLERAANYNLDTAQKANRTVSLMTIFSKGFCGGDKQAFEQANTILAGLAITAFIGYKVFTAASAA